MRDLPEARSSVPHAAVGDHVSCAPALPRSAYHAPHRGLFDLGVLRLELVYDEPFGPVPVRPPLSEEQRVDIRALTDLARAEGDHEAADQGEALLALDAYEREL